MADTQNTEPIRWMVDDDLADDIDALRPARAVDETPAGRLAGIDTDTWLVYREMHELLTGREPDIAPDAYAQRLADLAATLVDLHKRTEQAGWNHSPAPASAADTHYAAAQGHSPSELKRLRYPPDGDVDRWVREGTAGHVNYLGRDDESGGVPDGSH